MDCCLNHKLHWMIVVIGIEIMIVRKMMSLCAVSLWFMIKLVVPRPSTMLNICTMAYWVQIWLSIQQQLKEQRAISSLKTQRHLRSKESLRVIKASSIATDSRLLSQRTKVRQTSRIIGKLRVAGQLKINHLTKTRLELSRLVTSLIQVS